MLGEKEQLDAVTPRIEELKAALLDALSREQRQASRLAMMQQRLDTQRIEAEGLTRTLSEQLQRSIDECIRLERHLEESERRGARWERLSNELWTALRLGVGPASFVALGRAFELPPIALVNTLEAATAQVIEVLETWALFPSVSAHVTSDEATITVGLRSTPSDAVIAGFGAVVLRCLCLALGRPVKILAWAQTEDSLAVQLGVSTSQAIFGSVAANDG